MIPVVQVWRVEQKSWACLHEISHSFSAVTSILYRGGMLYVAGVPDERSSWSQTWWEGYAPSRRQGVGVGEAGEGVEGEGGGEGGGERNATKYTIARMSQSPAKFHGKYDTWKTGDGSGEGSGGGDDGGGGGGGGGDNGSDEHEVGCRFEGGREGDGREGVRVF